MYPVALYHLHNDAHSVSELACALQDNRATYFIDRIRPDFHSQEEIHMMQVDLHQN